MPKVRKPMSAKQGNALAGSWLDGGEEEKKKRKKKSKMQANKWHTKRYICGLGHRGNENAAAAAAEEREDKLKPLLCMAFAISFDR
jgi:hypothetical protein